MNQESDAMTNQPLFQQYHFEGIRHIPPVEALRLVGQGEALLLDVREAYEVEAARPGLDAGMLWIPMSELHLRINELPKDKTIIVMCAHGIRSVQVVHFLVNQQHINALNLDGAFEQWCVDRLPVHE